MFWMCGAYRRKRAIQKDKFTLITTAAAWVVARLQALYLKFSRCYLVRAVGDFYFTFFIQASIGPVTVLSGVPTENTSDMWLSPLK